VAFVVAKHGTTIDIDSLRTHCRANLAQYKVPSQFRLIEELPRSTVGKLDKIQLTALATPI
jgi:acyl-CoA synthetase (AMP-forming)/AMP-acid ligase II